MTNIISTVVYSLAPLRGPVVTIPCVPIGCYRPTTVVFNLNLVTTQISASLLGRTFSLMVAKYPPAAGRNMSRALCISPPWQRGLPIFSVFRR